MSCVSAWPVEPEEGMETRRQRCDEALGASGTVRETYAALFEKVDAGAVAHPGLVPVLLIRAHGVDSGVLVDTVALDLDAAPGDAAYPWMCPPAPHLASPCTCQAV